VPPTTLTTSAPSKIAIFGVYGNDSEWNSNTLDRLIAEIHALIERERFTVDQWVGLGGTWSNHLPVLMALRTNKPLVLLTPARWDQRVARFDISSRTLNCSHDLASRRLGRNTFTEIQSALHTIRGCCVYDCKSWDESRDAVGRLADVGIHVTMRTRYDPHEPRYGGTVRQMLLQRKCPVYEIDVLDDE
jgi:hypothetical protein